MLTIRGATIWKMMRQKWGMSQRMQVLAVFFSVCLYFVANANGSWRDFQSLHRNKGDLYNRLTNALLAGQTYLLVKPRPELLALKDPYNVEVARPYQLHDASLYRGKYYVYFGLTPVVTLLLPFRAVTGIDLPDGIATLIFALFGYGLSCALFRWLIRPISAGVPAWLKAGGCLSLGLCAFVPSALKSGDTYELAVMSAYCFLMGGSYLMLRALQAERRRPLLFVLAGLCFGLSVGGRPNYAVGVVLLVGLIAAAMLRLVKTVSISKGDFGYFAAPVVACGLCLAAYNYARFDNPLEFGFQYQLTDEPGMNQFHFHPRNLMYGVFYQMFSLPAFSRSLPFVHAQIQRLGSDHVPPGMILYPVVGVLAAMPLVLVGLLPFPGALAWRLSSPSNGAERLVVVVLLLVAGANFLVISAMGSYCVRYGVDFAPSLVLVAFVSLAFWLNGSGARYRKAAAIGVNIVVLVCACEGALLALSGGTGTNQTFLAHPKLFLRGVALINHITGGQTPPPSAAVDLQASIVFSDAPSDLMEPILTSGHAGMVTFIGVRYPHSGQVQFYYQHLQRLADFGKVVAISAGRPYSLDVRIDPDNSSVTIALDNAIVYQRRVPLYPIPLDEIVAGQNPVWSPGRAKFFSGKLEVRHFSATPSMLWRTDEPPVPPVTAPQ